MRAKLGWGLVWGAVLVTCFAAPSRRAAAANCALYARAATGVYLYGAAGGWWDEAAGRYQRGHVPQVGSILVFRRTGYTPSGHVAVVSRIISAREILVDHANWYRGTISRGMPVVDNSPANDWTTVAVMNLGSGTYGRDNPTYGFVYPDSGPREMVATAGTSGFYPYVAAVPAAYEPNPRAGLVHFAVATEYRHERTRHRAARKGRSRHSIRLAATAQGHRPGHGLSAVQAHPSAAHAGGRHAKTSTAAARQHRRA